MLAQFDHIICLNLESRKDRKNRVSIEFEKVGILDRVEFFTAVPGGRTGFNESMRRIFNTYEGNIFVFEDDATFINNPDLVDIAYSQLPGDWALFYLGANVRSKLKKYSTNLYRCVNSWTSHAIGYSDYMVEWLKENYTHKQYEKIFDEWMRANVQYKFHSFITKPMLCTQANGYSDLMGYAVNYRVIEKSEKWMN